MRHCFAFTRDKVFLYDLRGMELKQRLNLDNHLGRVVMSPNPSNHCPFLLFSNSINSGTFVVYDMETLSVKHKIVAHDSPIIKISTNFEGDFALTLSSHGSVIRMWNVVTGQKLMSFECNVRLGGCTDAS